MIETPPTASEEKFIMARWPEYRRILFCIEETTGNRMYFFLPEEACKNLALMLNSFLAGGADGDEVFLGSRELSAPAFNALYPSQSGEQPARE